MQRHWAPAGWSWGRDLQMIHVPVYPRLPGSSGLPLSEFRHTGSAEDTAAKDYVLSANESDALQHVVVIPVPVPFESIY